MPSPIRVFDKAADARFEFSTTSASTRAAQICLKSAEQRDHRLLAERQAATDSFWTQAEGRLVTPWIWALLRKHSLTRRRIPGAFEHRVMGGSYQLHMDDPVTPLDYPQARRIVRSGRHAYRRFQISLAIDGGRYRPPGYAELVLFVSVHLVTTFCSGDRTGTFPLAQGTPSGDPFNRWPVAS